MDTTDDRPSSARQRRRRQQTREQIETGDVLCEVILGIVVVGSALAIGTVHIPVLIAVSTFALVGGTLAAMALRSVPIPAIVLAVLGLFSALQALPLPAGLVTRLSPVSASVWLRCLIPFGEAAPTRFPLSLDAGASLAEALKWLTYAAVYLMANRVRSRRGSARLAVLLFGSASLVALTTLVHGVADLDVLYGFYQPNFTAGRWNVGPLLNSNNLGGYAILGLFSGAGLLLSGRSPVPRLPAAIGLGVICTALCLSGSRAAIASALLGGVATLVWLVQTQNFRFQLRHLVWGTVPFLIGIVVAITLGSASDWTEVTSLDAQRKVAVWRWSVPMIREHLLFGVGRGAFETAFSPYRRALDYDWTIVFTHAENFVVQWVAEWGVLVGVCAVLAIAGYVLRQWFANRSDRTRFMMMTGLVALLLQNLADLGLEVPAIAIAAVVALAAGELPKPRPETESAERLGWFALVGAVPALLLLFAVFTWSLSPVESERRALSLAYHELPVKSADERAQFRDLLHKAVERHPGESFFPLLGSLVAMRTGDGDALPWVGRALELAPASGRVHMVLAQLLHAHRATAQAMLHLRLAAQYDRTLAGLAGVRAAAWARSIDMLMQAIPEGRSGTVMLLDACAKEPQIQVRIDCFRRATARDSASSEARGLLAEALLVAIRTGQMPCGAQVEACVVEADTSIRAMSKLEPNAWRPGYLMAKLLFARGDATNAAKLLARVCPPNAEGDQCWREAFMIASKSGSDEAISGAANAYAARACDDAASCADILEWLATNLESGGKAPLAITFYTRAAEADPSAGRWLKVAEHATQAHLYGVAHAALQRADRSPDASPNSRAHTELLMQRVARATGATP
jgi:tetratricopeptide (TPR) repeat protein